MQCSAIDWDNFLRVDDQGNEIIVKFKESDVKPLYNEHPTREDKIKILDDMIENYEKLPAKALQNPVTGYDLLSALLVVSSIFKS
jgi:hypothetical protein